MSYIIDQIVENIDEKCKRKRVFRWEIYILPTIYSPITYGDKFDIKKRFFYKWSSITIYSRSKFFLDFVNVLRESNFKNGGQLKTVNFRMEISDMDKNVFFTIDFDKRSNFMRIMNRNLIASPELILWIKNFCISKFEEY